MIRRALAPVRDVGLQTLPFPSLSALFKPHLGSQLLRGQSGLAALALRGLLEAVVINLQKATSGATVSPEDNVLKMNDHDPGSRAHRTGTLASLAESPGVSADRVEDYRVATGTARTFLDLRKVNFGPLRLDFGREGFLADEPYLRHSVHFC